MSKMADEQAVEQGDTSQAGETEASTQTPQEGATQAAATTEAQPQATEAKAEGTKEAPKTDAKDKGLLSGAEDMQESVPEAYEDFDLGEGVDEADQNALKELAKEHKLTQEQANKAASFSKSIVQRIATDQEAALEQFKAENEKAWTSQPDHAEKTLMAQKAVKQLGPDMEAYLADNGHLYDAKILGVLSQLGKYMSEPSHIAGTDTAPSSSRIYGNSPELYSS